MIPAADERSATVPERSDDGAGANRTDLLILLIIVGAAAAVRISLLGHRMAVDESETFLAYAKQPLSFGLSSYVPNNHLLNTLLAHLSTRAFGSAPWAIRLPAFIAGVALVPATYLAGRRLYDRTAGLLAAALVAGSAALVEYSVNARGYTTIALCFTVLLALGPSLLRSKSLIPWAAYAATVAIGFYTIPTMMFAFGAASAWLVPSALVEPGVDRRRFFVRWTVATAAAGAASLALYSPVITTMGLKAVTSNGFVAPLTFGRFWSGFPSFIGDVSRYFTYAIPPIAVGLLVVGFAVGLSRHGRLARHRIPVAPVAALFVVFEAAVQRVHPFARVLLFLLPLFFITGAAGITFLLGRTRRRGPAVALALVAAVALPLHAAVTHAVDLSHERGGLPDVATVAAWLGPRLRPQDRVVATGTTVWPLRYYLGEAGVPEDKLLLPINAARRLYLVVNMWEHQTLASFLASIHATTSPPGVPGYGSLRLVRRSADSAVYELTRLERR